jgi:sterol desaturase/sphingolipid hydroxylase (fatty acid hydroxylase superfamily)
MNSINATAVAVPAVLLFTGIEYAYARSIRKSHVFDNSVANLSIGIAERLLYLFMAAGFYQLFRHLYAHYALLHIPATWYTWLLLLLATDFVWYWYHRVGHEVNIFWAAHVVHHQSEDFNYTVSARITALQAVMRYAFWSILPILGFNADMVMSILLVHGAYSFLTHTQMVPKLGVLEKIFITPSHHRVHHAANEQYLDKNYGDIFVFWDKLFGTFATEKEKPVYGLTHPLKSYSFLWQHFHFYLELWAAVRRQKGFGRKVKLLFSRPAAIDASIRPALERKFLRRSKTNTGKHYRRYLNVQLGASLLALCLFAGYFERFDAWEKLFITVAILLTLINCGAILEKRRWIHYLELSRIVVISALVSYAMHDADLFVLLLSSMAILFISLPVKSWYYKVVFR